MPHSPLARFDDVEDDAFLRILHGLSKKIKGKNLLLGIKFPLPVDAKDIEVNPLHMIFHLKKVLDGKEYFRINHLLLLLFNLVQGPTLLSKSDVPRLVLKELFMRCL